MPPKRVKTGLEKVSTKDLLRSIRKNLREKVRDAQAKSKKGKE